VTLKYLLQFYEEIKKYKPKLSTTIFPNISNILKNLEKYNENYLNSDKKPRKFEKIMNKPLDIISLDEVKEESMKHIDFENNFIEIQENSSEKKRNSFDENDAKMRKKANKTKTKSKDYHSDEKPTEENEENFNKMRRKTVNVSEIDQLIIKSFISDDFGNILFEFSLFF